MSDQIVVSKFRDWSKGMVTAASRMDLPEDALFYAENVDFSIPMRSGLLDQDAMLGSWHEDVAGDPGQPSPNHNLVAEADTGLAWKIFNVRAIEVYVTTSTNAASTDIGSTVSDDGVAIGALLAIDTTGTNTQRWIIRDTDASHGTIASSSAMTIAGGSAAGTAVYNSYSSAYGTGSRAGTVQFAGDEWWWRTTHQPGDRLDIAALNDTEWSPIGVGIGADPCVSGSNLVLPLSGGLMAMVWDHGVSSLTVGGQVLTLDLNWTENDSAPDTPVLASVVYRLMEDTGKYIAFFCVKGHDASSNESAPEYLPGNSELVMDDDASEWKGWPWMEFWQRLGTYDSALEVTTAWGGGGTYTYTEAWSDSETYTAPHVDLNITGEASGASIAIPAFGTHIPVEYSGQPPADSATSHVGRYNGRTYRGGIILDGTGNQDWPSTDDALVDPGDNGLLGNYDPTNYAGSPAHGFVMRLHKLSSPIPPETLPGGRDNCAIWERSMFLEPPQWEQPQELRYYAVYEHDHGGFSRPEYLGSFSVASSQSAHEAIGFKIYMDLGYWSESVRRVHFFRSARSATEGGNREAWLFAIDRETSSWIHAGAAPTGSSMYLLSPSTEVIGEGVGDEIDVDGYPYGGKGTVGTDHRNYYQIRGDMGLEIPANEGWGTTQYGSKRWISAITRAFLEAAEEGLNLTPVVKGGMGIFSFVDYGQPTGDSALSVLGAGISDMLGETAVLHTSLDYIDVALGRAFYSDGTAGKVWYSELDRLTIIGSNNFLSFQNSGELVAVRSLHGYLVLFFEYKTVIIDSRSGLDSGWSVVQELNGVGLAGRDCVDTYQSLIAWAGSGSIWLWDGSGRPEQVSKAIEYPGFSEDMHHMASEENEKWLAIDPARKEILFYLSPTDGYSNDWGTLLFQDTESMGAKVLVYSIATGAWSCERFRGERGGQAVTGEGTYDILRRPFVRANYLLIPCEYSGTGYKMLLVRQGYIKFLGQGVSHDTYWPPWKRQVLETGFIAVGAFETEKRIRSLAASFTGPLGGKVSLPIAAAVLDNWTIDLHLFNNWDDTLGTSLAWMLGDRTAEYSWDVSTETDGSETHPKGYHKSIYKKLNTPTQQHSYYALRLESQGASGVYDTKVTKVELGQLAVASSPKAVI